MVRQYSFTMESIENMIPWERLYHVELLNKYIKEELEEMEKANR